MFLLGQLKALQSFIWIVQSKRKPTRQNLKVFMKQMSKDTVANCERDYSREKRAGVWKNIIVENVKVSEYRDR